MRDILKNWVYLLVACSPLLDNKEKNKKKRRRRRKEYEEIEETIPKVGEKRKAGDQGEGVPPSKGQVRQGGSGAGRRQGGQGN